MHENDSKKDETALNGRTANINIPGDSHMMSSSPKSPKSPPSQSVAIEKRNSLRHNQEIVVGGGNGREKEHMNGAKVVGNHYNNNSKVNSACLNNLILPLLSEVSCVCVFTHLSLLLHCF
jgi:hypothetical protein